MKHLAAYLLLTLGGNTSPSAKDISAVLESVGIEADNDRLETLLKELKGKDINEVRQHAWRHDNWTVDTDKCAPSSSLRVRPSLLPFPPAALVVPPLLLVALLLPAVPLRRSPRRRRRRRRRSPTTTWDSVSSTKRFSAEGYQKSRWNVFQVVYEHCRDKFTHDDCQGWFGVFRVTWDASATAFRRHIEGNQKERLGIFSRDYVSSLT
jgi:hypothetical protein